MNDFLLKFNEVITQVSGGNQVIAGALALWLLTVGSYLLKSVPNRIYQFAKKHLTTELTIQNSDMVYYHLCRWIEKQDFAQKLRKIKINNGMDGWDDDLYKSIGYGSHLVWVGWRPIYLSISKENSQSDKFKETISLTYLGRSHTFFNELITNLKEKDAKRYVHIYSRMGWQATNDCPIRPVDTVAIESEKLDDLLKRIQDFLDKEDWYVRHAIPYQLGILLHGPPGTGKTSLIKALASHFHKHVAIIKNESLSSLDDALSNTPKDAIIAIEDVDGSRLTHDRGDKADGKEKDGIYTISTLLNAIDGLVSHHGRILIMTTNHREKLDPALIRPGRVDIDMEIGYIGPEAFKNYVERFFPGASVPGDLVLNQDKLTGAQLQNDVLSGLGWEEIVNKYSARPDHENI